MGLIKEVALWTYRFLMATGILLICVFCIFDRPSIPVAALGSSAVGDPSVFISIILSAVTVILTALTIILAIAAAAGYVTVKEAVKDAARDMAKKVAMVEMENLKSMAARIAEEVSAQKTGQGQSAGDQISQVINDQDQPISGQQHAE